MIANSSQAKSLSINVYLKLKPDNPIQSVIQNLNLYLSQNENYKQYEIIPYLEKYPLHVTLYLANYHPKQIPEIIRKVKKLVQHQHSFSISTSKFIPERSGYLMLGVTSNHTIKDLSKKVLIELAPLRDLNAVIPAWAAHDPVRKTLFSQYGSPTVLDYFNPHLSIFSAEHLNDQQKSALFLQLFKLISKYNQSHSTQIQQHVSEIGVGIANAQGQIIKELAIFSMK